MTTPPRRTLEGDLKERIENDFIYHAPFGDQVQRYAEIRNEFKSLALFLCEKCPLSRELSMALTSLETACFQANAAIARNEKPLTEKE